MSLKKNILANVMGKLWGFISVFLFVPFYVSLLGVESYGMISFYTMLQSFLLLADAGLTATLNREFAKDVKSDINHKQNLLKTFECIYLFICLVVFIFVWFSSDFIVSNFIESKTIPFEQSVRYVRQMGGIISISIMTSLYFGGLMGLQKQVLGNILSITYSLAKASVLIILFFYPSLDIYFLFQIQITAIYLICLRYNLRKQIKTGSPPVADFKCLSKIWRYSAGMMLMAVIAAGNTQIDKLMVSKLMTLSQFANYSIATTAGQATLFFALPIALAMFPELTRLVSVSEHVKVKRIFHQYATLIAIITSVLTVALVSYTHELLFLWTRDEIIANDISPSTRILAVGTLFLSLQYAPFYLSLAYGNTKTNIYLGLIILILLVPLFYILIPAFGLLGATIPWLFTNIIGTLYLGKILIGKFLPNEFNYWLVYDTLIPLSISFICGVFSYYIFSAFASGALVLVFSILSSLICVFFNGIYYFKLYPEDLSMFLDRLKIRR